MQEGTSSREPSAQFEAPKIGVVMAGGSGERFWPLSTGNTPKQLLCLTHPTKNMLEEALERLDGIVDHKFVSTSAALAPVIANSGFVSNSSVLAEPAKRNTLGALVWVVAELIARGYSNSVVAVVTADHFIGELNRFQQCVSYALAIAAETNEFVTFGIPPTRPETGYGYIHIDRANDQACISTPQAFRSVAFKEKPDFDTAVQYVASRNYLWNSGMFFFSITGFRRNLELAQPATAVALRDIVQALESGDHVSAKSCFETIPNLSIDYAVMEKVPYVLTVPATFSWDDVGAWDALERTAEAGEANNAVRGNPILVDVSSSVIVQADPTVHVALLGVQDLIVVSTKHAVMVCHKSQAQRVRELARLVKLLEEESKVDSL